MTFVKQPRYNNVLPDVVDMLNQVQGSYAGDPTSFDILGEAKRKLMRELDHQLTEVRNDV